MSRLLVVLLLVLGSVAFAAEATPPADAPPTTPPVVAPPTGQPPEVPPAGQSERPGKPPKTPKPPRLKGTAVQLQNPGFDEELKGWDNAAAPAMVGAFTLDQSIKRTGKAALHVKPQSPEQWPWISQKIAPVDPGATYMLTVWHQGGTDPQTDTCAALKFEFLDAAGKPLSSRVARQQVRMQAWQFLAVAAQAPRSPRRRWRTCASWARPRCGSTMWS